MKRTINYDYDYSVNISELSIRCNHRANLVPMAFPFSRPSPISKGKALGTRLSLTSLSSISTLQICDSFLYHHTHSFGAEREGSTGEYWFAFLPRPKANISPVLPYCLSGFDIYFNRVTRAETK